MDDSTLRSRLAQASRGRAGAIALLTPGGERVLTHGCSSEADFEIGSAMQPWTGASIAPAGGLRASIAAMTSFTRSLLDGTGPGVAALDPVAAFAGPAVRIGAAWLTTDRRRRGPLTWHNGGTGGFRSFLGLRRDVGFGVVVLSASARGVVGFAITALDELGA